MGSPSINVNRKQHFCDRPNDHIKNPWKLDPSEIQLSDRVLAYAEHLGRRWGADVKERYLKLQIESCINPPTGYSISALKKHALNPSRIDITVREVLHPLCVPKRLEDVKLLLGDRGVRCELSKLRKVLNDLTEDGDLIKRPNPWRGNTWVYSHPDWDATPQPGDKVVQLSRRHGGRTAHGIVLRWERERSLNKVAPIVRFERHYGVTTEFADPASLIIIDRPITEPEIKICS
jgi:hypothetical protein